MIEIEAEEFAEWTEINIEGVPDSSIAFNELENELVVVGDFRLKEDNDGVAGAIFEFDGDECPNCGETETYGPDPHITCAGCGDRR